MGIPAAPLAELDRLDFDRLSNLVKAADFDLTRRAFPAYQGYFRDFFAHNGIKLRTPVTRFGA